MLSKPIDGCLNSSNRKRKVLDRPLDDCFFSSLLNEFAKCDSSHNEIVQRRTKKEV